MSVPSLTVRRPRPDKGGNAVKIRARQMPRSMRRLAAAMDKFPAQKSQDLAESLPDQSQRLEKEAAAV